MHHENTPPWATIGSRWKGLAVLLVGQAMGSWGAASMSITAPDVGASLHLPIDQLQLVASSFSFMLTTFLVTGARLGANDQRAWFRTGSLILALSGTISAFAFNGWILLIGQLLAGLGSAILVPQVLSLIQLRFSGSARAIAISLYTMSLGAGVAGGVLVTGYLMSFLGGEIGWRVAFFLYTPIGAWLAYGATRYLIAVNKSRNSRLDTGGLLLFSISLSLITVTLNIGSHHGWPVWSILSGLAGLVILVIFSRYEIYFGKQGRQPLLDIDLLASLIVSPALYVVLVTMGGYGTLIYVLSSYLQQGAGFSTLNASLIFSAYALAFAGINLFWTKLPQHLHKIVSPIALASLTLTQFMLLFATGPQPALLALIGLLALCGLSHGAGFGALVARVMVIVPHNQVSSISALINTAAQLGVFLGIAFLGGIYTNEVQPQLPSSYSHALIFVLPTLSFLSMIAFLCSSWICFHRK